MNLMLTVLQQLSIATGGKPLSQSTARAATHCPLKSHRSVGSRQAQNSLEIDRKCTLLRQDNHPADGAGREQVAADSALRIAP
jgi:hypothetical protein